MLGNPLEKVTYTSSYTSSVNVILSFTRRAFGMLGLTWHDQYNRDSTLKQR